MKPAADELAIALESITFNTPILPVINNADVETEVDPEAIKFALVKQLYNPVRWTETVERMAEEGISLLIEMGPGKVLTGLTKRIDKSLDSIVVNDSATLNAAK